MLRGRTPRAAWRSTAASQRARGSRGAAPDARPARPGFTLRRKPLIPLRAAASRDRVLLQAAHAPSPVPLQAAIPALMSGQIIAGAHPGQAAALQAAALLCMAACTALAAAAAVAAAVVSVVDGMHRVRPERLHTRGAAAAGAAGWGRAQLLRVRMRACSCAMLCSRPSRLCACDVAGGAGAPLLRVRARPL
jgi:hypothetical protein